MLKLPSPKSQDKSSDELRAYIKGNNDLNKGKYLISRDCGDNVVGRSVRITNSVTRTQNIGYVLGLISEIEVYGIPCGSSQIRHGKSQSARTELRWKDDVSG